MPSCCQRRMARSDRSRELLHAVDPNFVDLLVVARDLLDHPHDPSLLAITLEIPAIRLEDAILRGVFGRVGETRIVRRRRELRFLELGDLSKQLLLGVEVVVVGAVREPGAVRDVGDPGVEEAVTFEHLLRRRAPGARVSPSRDGSAAVPPSIRSRSACRSSPRCPLLVQGGSQPLRGARRAL